MAPAPGPVGPAGGIAGTGLGPAGTAFRSPAQVQQPLFKLGPLAAPLCERAEDLLDHVALEERLAARTVSCS